MYSVISILFIIGVLLILSGFIGRLGTVGISDVSENVAASLALLSTYAILIISLNSFTELSAFFESIMGGLNIPFLSDIADYGSLENMFSESPLSAATAFLDTVILSAIIDTIMLLPLAKGTARGKFMVDLFIGVIVGIVSLLLLNYVIKATPVYHGIVSIIGGIIALVSVGTVPLLIVSLLKKPGTVGAGIIGVLLLFSRSKIAGILRSAFLKAIVYVCGIWMLEKHFDTIANGLSQLSALLIAFGPVLILLIGLAFIVKSIKA